MSLFQGETGAYQTPKSSDFEEGEGSPNERFTKSVLYAIHFRCPLTRMEKNKYEFGKCQSGFQGDDHW